jgi:transcriptional regulator with XRE-family HTH domain
MALAERLGVNHSNIAFWERWDKPPRGDVLPRLAQALGVTLEDLLQTGVQLKTQHPSVKGKLQKIFEEASRLPRRQQQKILDIIEPFIQKHKAA